MVRLPRKYLLRLGALAGLGMALGGAVWQGHISLDTSDAVYSSGFAVANPAFAELAEVAQTASGPSSAALEAAIAPAANFTDSLPSLAPAPLATAAEDICPAQLTLEALPDAILRARVSEPCAPGGRVVLRHAGLVFAASLDAQGQGLFDFPALERGGEVSVLFAMAGGAKQAQPVTGLDAYSRLVVQWIGDDRFRLHADGAEEAGDAAGAHFTLGDPDLALPMQAEIYSWPVAIGRAPAIEAEVTELSCGRELLAETLFAKFGRLSINELSLSMPDCTAVGDILVLNNLLTERTLAATN